MRFFVIPLVLFLFACSNGEQIRISETDPDNGTPPIEKRALTAQEQVLVDGSNDFTFELLQQLAHGIPEESFFVSPLSLSMAFGMALNGAAGETYTQMTDVFSHGGLSNDEINAAFRDLIALLRQLDPQIRMEIANSIWYRETFEVVQAFIETNAEYFDAEIAALDFDDPEAPDIMNAWIAESTEGLIDELIDDIGDDMVLYLINAIYFRGDWSLPFDPDVTQDQPFTTGAGAEVNVPLMSLTAGFGYYQDDDWQVVDLPYGGEGDFSFTAFLPRNEEDLSAFAGSLTRSDFTDITDQLGESRIQVYLPRFEIDFEYDALKGDLQAMGLRQAFDPHQADFSRINATEDLYVSEVMHRAVINVDEEGTEAAAATGVGIGVTSAPPTIRMDRPFLFFLRETSSNTILFLGKYAGP